MSAFHLRTPTLSLFLSTLHLSVAPSFLDSSLSTLKKYSHMPINKLEKKHPLKSL